nr:zinc finger BED domain-containing protein RICESLEEPER 2-like [Ipomoea batatas]
MVVVRDHDQGKRWRPPAQVVARGHYFHLCFDFHNARCEIIDKSTVPTSKQLKYSDCLEDMDMLSEFFKTSHPAKYAICVGLDAKRMQMDWQDSKNKVDCGGVSHASHGDVCKPMGCPTGSMVFPKVTVLSCTSSDYIT